MWLITYCWVFSTHYSQYHIICAHDMVLKKYMTGATSLYSHFEGKLLLWRMTIQVHQEHYITPYHESTNCLHKIESYSTFHDANHIYRIILHWHMKDTPPLNNIHVRRISLRSVSFLFSKHYMFLIQQLYSHIIEYKISIMIWCTKIDRQ